MSVKYRGLERLFAFRRLDQLVFAAASLRWAFLVRNIWTDLKKYGDPEEDALGLRRMTSRNI